MRKVELCFKSESPVNWHWISPLSPGGLFALEGEVIEMEGLGIRELEGDCGTGGLRGGAESAEFWRFECEGERLRLRGRNLKRGFGGTVIVNVETEEDTG